MFECTRLQKLVQIFTARAHTCTHKHTHVKEHTHTHTNAHVNTNTLKHTNALTYAHVHTPTQTLSTNRIRRSRHSADAEGFMWGRSTCMAVLVPQYTLLYL